MDTLLTAIRDAISTDGADGFPVDAVYEVMAKRGKSLAFTDSELDELAEMEYGDKRLFTILTMLYPFVDVANHHFHVDHVFPYARFTKPRLRKAGVDDEDLEEFRDMANRLPNLQLLEGGENLAKQASLPVEWMNETMKPSARSNYCDNHLLGSIPESITQFRQFYELRKDALKERLRSLLGVS